MPTTSPPTSIRHSRRRKTWPAAVWLGVSGTLALGAFLAASQASDAATDDILYDPGLAVSGAIFYGVMILISFAIALAYPRPVEALGFRRFRLRWLWISFAVVVATTIVAVAVEPILHGGEDQGLAADRWQPEHAAAFAANALVLILLTAVDHATAAPAEFVGKEKVPMVLTQEGPFLRGSPLRTSVLSTWTSVLEHASCHR